MKRYLLPLVIVLLRLAATVLWVWTPRTVPPGRASDLYRQYASNPHLTVSYIEDFHVNDTLSLPVTTIRALDSAGWDLLTNDFNIPNLPEIVLSSMEENEDFVLTFIASGDYKDRYEELGISPSNAISLSYRKHEVSIFNTRDVPEQNAVLKYNIKHSIIKRNSYE